MRPERSIIAILAPSHADLTPTLPFLRRSGTVEHRLPSMVYLETPGRTGPRPLRRRLALIRSTVQSILGTPVRIGTAANKAVALVAARAALPGGVAMVPSGTEVAFLDQIVIDLMPGIGRRTATYLRNRGVTTIGKFARLPQTLAVRLFGLSGIALREFSRGSDPRDVIPTSPPQPVIGRRSLFAGLSIRQPQLTLTAHG